MSEYTKKKKVYELLISSKELRTYTRPYIRSWRQKHFPKDEFERLIKTRTPEQIAEYMRDFVRTGRKSWSGQLVFRHEMDDIETNELHTEGGVLTVAVRPDKDGKIVVLGEKEQ